MTLTVHAAIDRSLVVDSATSERYLMLTLEAPPGAVRRLPLNLALVIDRSGSMSGEKLERVKEAAGFVVRHLTGADHVAIVAYDDEVGVVAPSTRLSPRAKTDLLARMHRIETGGMTNLGGGWLTGCQEVARHQEGDAGMDRVLLLTDGLANVGITHVEELVEHARQLRLRGIVTSTMGVGADFNEELLEALARHGGGRFQYVATAKSIPDCVQGELGEMMQVAARKVAVEVALPAGVRVQACLNDYVLEETARGARVYVGDVLAGDTRHVLLKLAVRAGAVDASLVMRALALYVDTATGAGTEAPFPTVELRYASQEAVDYQATDDVVAREVALVLAARAKEEAVRQSRRGDHSAAAQTLAGASAALSASPYAAQPAVVQEIDALAPAAAQGLSEQQRKGLHYQSYLARMKRRRYGDQ